MLVPHTSLNGTMWQQLGYYNHLRVDIELQRYDDTVPLDQQQGFYALAGAMITQSEAIQRMGPLEWVAQLAYSDDPSVTPRRIRITHDVMEYATIQ